MNRTHRIERLQAEMSQAATASLAGPALLSRRDLLRLGGLALGAAGLSATGLARAGSAEAATPFDTVADYDASIATHWFDLALELVTTAPGFSPPVVARVLGYMGVALYEALRPGMPGALSLAGRLTDLTPPPVAHSPLYQWEVVANSALATVVRGLIPNAGETTHAQVRAQEPALHAGFKQGLPQGIAKRSERHGRAVAEHVLAWASQDGGHDGHLRNFPAGYTAPTGPVLWEPTLPGFQKALQPYWGSNRPMALADAAEFDPGPPPAYSEEPGSAGYIEAFEVYDTVNNLTPEQLEIALFWADNAGVTATPAGHSVSILTQTLQQLDARLDLAAEAYARVGIAVSDAFISCWACKFHYNLLRPISYIRNVIDPTWGDPLPVATPPFPEYTSGHSVQTAAATQVMFDLFGDLPITDYTHYLRGHAPRTFTGWSELAEETAISRLYGGIHFRSAIERGIEQGRAVGRKVSALQMR